MSKHIYYSLDQAEQKRRIKEVGSVFLKLGTIAFGGPAAHIAMMEDEIVRKRQWVDKEKFMDLIGATNLIPGPNSTELAIHLGYERAGWRGLVIAGITFILPAMLIVLLFAHLYKSYGRIPEISNMLYGIKPVIIAIVFQALLRLGQSAIKSKKLSIIGIVVIALCTVGVNEVALLVGAGVVMIIITNGLKWLKGRIYSFSPIYLMAGTLVVPNAEMREFGLLQLFGVFLKIGSVLYGSGYVLLAFLDSEFVEKMHLLTNTQLLDAVAVGQFTPGPVFTTATFIGYLIEGTPGALVATIGIFLPAFILVALLNPFISKLRQSIIMSSFLDGVNVASWGLMAVVSIKLGFSAIVDIPTIILAAVSMVIIFKYKINTAWLVLFGGISGVLISML
jgi:chromate transporter